MHVGPLALVVACLLKKEPEHRLEALHNNGPELRNVFLNVKSRLQTYLQRRRNGRPALVPNDVVVPTLFSDPMNSSVQFRAAAFPPNGQPVAPLPWTMLELQTLASRVPCRSTNRSAYANPHGLNILNGFPRAVSNHMALPQGMILLSPITSSAMLTNQASDDISLQILARQRRPLEALWAVLYHMGILLPNL